MAEIDRILPHDEFIEGGVIGTVLCSQDVAVFRQAFAIVKPEMFYSSVYRQIWSALQRCVDAGDPPTIFHVYNHLDKSKCDEVEARVLMARESRQNYTLAGIDSLAYQVRDEYLRRHAIAKADAATEAAYAGAEVGKIREAFALDIQEVGTDEGYEDRDTVASSALGEMETRREQGDVLGGITTGISKIDNLIDGFKPGQLIYLAARPSVGKTAIALYMGFAAARSGVGVGVVSLEMRGVDLEKRIFSMGSGVALDRVIKGKMSEEEWQRVCEVAAEQLSVFYADQNYTIDGIEHAIYDMHQRNQIGLAIVDYLQLIEPGGALKKGETRDREIGEMSRRLKKTAMITGIPILALSQLSRNAAGRAPRLSDLRDSGTLEQDGDIVIFLDRPAMRGKKMERKSDNVAVDLTKLLVVDVAKQRQGPRGESYFEYHPECNALLDWDEDKFVR